MFQLVKRSIIEQRVLRRGGRIAEAIAEVPAERHTVQFPRRARPVPRVVVGPHAAAPIQDGKEPVRGQLEFFSAKLDPAGRAQAVDLLVVVKMAGLVEGRGNDDALNRLVRQGKNALNRVLAAEVVHVKGQLPRAVLMVKGQSVAGRGNFARAKPGAFGKMRLSHRKQPHGAFRDLEAFVEVQKRNRV